MMPEVGAPGQSAPVRRVRRAAPRPDWMPVQSVTAAPRAPACRTPDVPPRPAPAAAAARPVRGAERRPARRRRARRGRRAAALLVIAGAGSGKTMTLASRVARLVLDGADPQRLLLLTFSRRAAQEMERRAGRVLHQALGLPSTQRPPTLPWAGTFHGVGARLLREHAPRDRPGRELHDPRPRRRRRPDGLGAPGARPGRDEEPLPAEGHLPGDLLARRQQPGAAAGVLAQRFPWCGAWEDELKGLFGAYVASQAAAARARLRRPAALLVADDGRRRRSRARSARASTTCWSTSTRTRTGCRPRSCWRSSPTAAG